MMKFIYIADSHAGTDFMGYQQQKGYPEKLPDILTAFDAWITEEGGVDFVLHGGDMIDSVTADNIRYSARLFRLSVPVYLCLGNHDLTERASLDLWMEWAPRFFPRASPNYSIETDDCVVHVIPNHWCDVPYFWSGKQEACFFEDQLTQLEAQVKSHREAVHILSTHSPVFGLPPEQTGFPDPLHTPVESFSSCVTELIRLYPQVRCVLGAHNHMNMNIAVDGVNYVTASALTETPFEFKLFTVASGSVRMSTISLLDRINFKAEYDFNKTYVQGRGKDREIL
jgi:hypothetical protein